ncbi:MAG: transcription termination/antitermination protein NusG [Planctomycetota bacterium]
MSDQTQQPEVDPGNPIAGEIVQRAEVDTDTGGEEAAQPAPERPAPVEAAPDDASVIAASEDETVGLDESSTGDDAASTADEAASAEPLDDTDDEGDEEEEVAVAPMGPIEELSEEEQAEDVKIDWYILKVQSNRERTSSEALKRKVAIEGLDHLFGDIIVPTEKVTEFKNGKKRTVERKIWPGYIAVQMHVNDDTWFAIRETAGIGDFTGASGKPIPMSREDVEKILPKEESEEGEDDTPKLNIKFAEGDKVKVTDGNFENFEGEVDSIDQQSGKISVMISIFGRSTPVELEYWQVEKL